MRHQLEKAGLINQKEAKEIGELGFTKDFYRFVGLGMPNDYHHPLPTQTRTLIEDMRTDSAQSFYTPLDDMYGTASGGDTWYDYGRVPVSHLEVLASKRIGVLYTACSRPAHDIFDNGFEFVKASDPQGDVIENSTISTIKRWMRRTYFTRKLMEVVEFDSRSGLGHLNAEKYIKEEASYNNWQKKAPATKPEKFATFSPYYMTPTNVHQRNVLDYDRQKWKFTGGLTGAHNIHESRVYVYEGRREQLGLRGLALGELCWVACMCYLNLQYYILKSMAQLGTVMVGINVDREFPTTAETEKYLALMKTMKANNFFVLGRGAQLQVQNAASKIGGGIKEFMEFLKEDMSAAWVFPKNQLFGRAQGGGLEGAGAIVSKEDYVASNVSVKQSKIKHDIMYILQEMCGFNGLENYLIRFNIDLHKTAEQRYKEQLMKEQAAQAEMMTEQMKLSQTLFRKQLKLQKEMADVQYKMLQKEPEKVFQESEKDEENKEREIAEPTKDFISLRNRYTILAEEYTRNQKLLDMMDKNMSKLNHTLQKENSAYKELYQL